MTTQTETTASPSAATLPEALAGAWVWVWNTGPDETAMANADGAIVRAANGGGTVADGVDFKANYAKWAQQYGALRCAAWTFVYTTTNAKLAADVLVGAAPNAPAYVVDVEDYKGHTASSETCETFCKRMKELRPRIPLGFSSYPTRAQATSHDVPWDTLLAHCDFGLPQVYEPYQGARLADGTVYADHKPKPVQVAVQPARWSDWGPAAKKARARDGSVSVWALPLEAKWWPAIRSLRKDEHPLIPVSVTAELVELDLSDAGMHPVKHRLVANLQGLLKATRQSRFDPGAIDGEATTKTLTAVRAYQKAKGLQIDGIVGAKTWRSLISG